MALTAGLSRIDASAPQGEIDAESFQYWRRNDGAPWATFYHRSGGYLLRFHDLADFLVSHDGGDIIAKPTPSASLETVRHLYGHHVAPLAASLRKTLTLHASAVVIEAGAVAFIAPSGSGKSTLAASIAQRGFPLLADDGIALHWQDGRPMAQPDSCIVRLWNDSWNTLIGTRQCATHQVEYSEKLGASDVPGITLAHREAELRAVLFLEPEDGDAQRSSGRGEVRFDVVPAPNAVVRLTANSFLLDRDAAGAAAWHFSEIARLAAPNGPVTFLALRYPRDFERLIEVGDAILAKFGATTAPSQRG